MNMMNKCAKFHKDSPSGKKVKFNLARAIELWETAVLCTILYRNLMQASNFGGTFDQLFLWIFLWNFHRMPLNFFYTTVQKSQKWRKPKSRGPALIRRSEVFFRHSCFSKVITIAHVHISGVIYIYKTVMFDRVFALWPCACSGAVLRHPSGTDETRRVPETSPGPPNSFWEAFF